jgi:CheY-like chemotaxis protein
MYKILLVEDEIVLRETLGEILEFHDFEVRVAGSGANALEMLSIWIPDLIVSDVMMPVMTGFELILKVRKIPGLVNIPVVFLSALAGDDERRKGLDLGAFDFITKPFRSADLVAILNEKLNFKN